MQLTRSMTPSLVLIAALTFAGTLAGSPPAAHAASDTFFSKIEGDWQATRSDSKARSHIDESIEALLGEMYFFKRPFARSRLKEATTPCSELTFEDKTNGRILIRCDQRKPAVSKADGTPTTYVDEEGTSYTLRQTLHDNRITQVFEGDSGTRTNVYRLTDDGKLELDVTLEAGQLPSALEYEREFKRDKG